MKAVSGILLALCVSSSAGLAERIADPFERHGLSYTLEGPQTHSEVFYLSSNWYDNNGEKHDDRTGDLLLITSLASGLGAIALRFRAEYPAPSTQEIQ
jgi:hypothetical protein